MVLNLELQPRTTHERAAHVVWDSEAGRFEGPDAELLEELCRFYADSKILVSHPYPTSYPCDDPFHNPAHLAAVVSKNWRLPEALRAYLEVPEGGKMDIRVLY